MLGLLTATPADAFSQQDEKIDLQVPEGISKKEAKRLKKAAALAAKAAQPAAELATSTEAPAGVNGSNGTEPTKGREQLAIMSTSSC